MIVYRVYNIEGGYIEYSEIPEGMDYEIIDKSLTPEEIERLEDLQYPCVVTALQFKLELIESDLTSEIEAVIDSLSGKDRSIALAKYNFATEFDRKDPLVQQLGLASGMTKQDINEFFLRAYER